MRILPSWSSGTKRNVGSTSSLTTVEIEPVALGDRLEVRDAGAAQRVGADPHAGVPDRVDVDHVRKVVDVGADVVVRVVRRLGRAISASPPRAARWPRPRCLRDDVSAGPPLGGLYL